MIQIFAKTFYKNKDENVHRFALSAIRGKLLEIQRERKRVRERLEEIVSGYYTRPGYLLSLVKIKREIERERAREREKSET